MLHILAKHGGAQFGPEEIDLLVDAFDKCWKRLQESGAQYHSDRALQAARERLGRGIIESAKRGERDPQRLCEDAMLHMAKSARRDTRPRR